MKFLWWQSILELMMKIYIRLYCSKKNISHTTQSLMIYFDKLAYILYIRFHQMRLIMNFYGNPEKSDLFLSLCLNYFTAEYLGYFWQPSYRKPISFLPKRLNPLSLHYL